jgi:hypothetical protein
MNKAVAVVVFSLTVAPAFAVKPCEELKSEIAARLDANGVKNYSLEIVANDDVKDQNVVGSCDGGTKKIVYKKDAGSPSAKPPATASDPGHK